MTSVAFPRRGIAAFDERALRFSLNKHEQMHKPPYNTIPHPRTSSDEMFLPRQFNKISSEYLLENKNLQKEKSITSIGITSDDSLTFRSLPPIKISIKQGSRNKFMGTKITEPVEASGVFQPSYSVKTYRSGHNIFTEGISERSTLPSPTFALKSMEVPYSNMPDNIAVHKTKNRFTFGIKSDIDEEMEISPYRLSGRPSGSSKVDFMDYCMMKKGMKTTGSNKDGKVISTDKERHMKNSSGFRCKLASTKHALENEIVLDYPYAGRQDVIDSYATEHPTAQKSRSPTKTSKRHIKERARSLSIVSIGDSVTPTHFDREKRYTRKNYPMYDWKASQTEALTKAKFGARDVNCAQSDTNKPTGDKLNFDWSKTRLSTTLLQFDICDMKDIGKQKSNLSPITAKSKFPFSRQKTSETLLYDESDPEFDLNKIYNMKKSRYQLRKLHPKFRKRLNQTSSNSSDSSSETTSTVIQNPPPSVRSHSIRDDMGACGSVEPKLEMIALKEEREKSDVSLLPDNGQTGTGIVPLSGRNDKAVAPVVSLHKKQFTPGQIIIQNTTLAHLCVEKMNIAKKSESKSMNDINKEENDVVTASKQSAENKDKIEKSAENETNMKYGADNKENSIKSIDQKPIANKSGKPNGENNDDETSKRNKYDLTTTDESDCSDIYSFQRTRMISDFEKTIVEEYIESPREVPELDKIKRSQRNNPKHKATLLVPTVSLDKLSHHPTLQHNLSSASLSRSLQNLQHDIVLPRKELTEANIAYLNEIEKQGGKRLVSITQVRLHSPPETCRSLITPAASLTDEFGAYKPIYISNENVQMNSDRSDKKLVNSTNISFTSPLVNEPKAKRQ